MSHDSLYDFEPRAPKIIDAAEFVKRPAPSFNSIFDSEQKERRERYPQFAELVEVEPALAILEHMVCKVRREHGSMKARRKPFDFCANMHWYGHTNLVKTGGEHPLFIVRPSLRDALTSLVGWFAAKPDLRNEHAYDIAYEHLYSLLPDCHGCNCIPIERPARSRWK